MISRKHHKIVFSFFMAIMMSCIMSLAISIFNVGLVADIVTVWLKAWSFAFLLAFPTIFVISPLVHKLVGLVLHEEG
jgi:TctA family transporter